jgi:hypothetical protein
MGDVGYKYGNTSGLDATYTGALIANKFTNTETGAIQSLSLWMKGTGGVAMTLGIYSHDAANNRPGSLIATTASVSCSVTNAYQTVNTTSNPTIDNGTIYWFVYSHSTSVTNLICYTLSVSGARWGYNSRSYGALPATYPGALSGPYDGLAISQYATLSAGSSVVYVGSAVSAKCLARFVK